MNRARVGRMALAVGLATTSAVISLATRSGGPGGYLELLAGVSLVVFTAGVAARLPVLVAAGVAGLGATQVFGHLRTDDAPELVAVVALLTAAFEIGCWSMELVTPVADERGVHRARWAWVLGWGVGGGALAALVLSAVTMPLGDRFPLDLLAVAAALLVLGAIAGSATSFPGHGAGDAGLMSRKAP